MRADKRVELEYDDDETRTIVKASGDFNGFDILDEIEDILKKTFGSKWRSHIYRGKVEYGNVIVKVDEDLIKTFEGYGYTTK